MKLVCIPLQISSVQDRLDEGIFLLEQNKKKEKRGFIITTD